MTDQQTERLSFSAMAQGAPKALAVILTLLLIVLEVTTAYLSTQGAIKLRAVAGNARVKQDGEVIPLSEQEHFLFQNYSSSWGQSYV